MRNEPVSHPRVSLWIRNFRMRNRWAVKDSQNSEQRFEMTNIATNIAPDIQSCLQHDSPFSVEFDYFSDCKIKQHPKGRICYREYMHIYNLISSNSQSFSLKNLFTFTLRFQFPLLLFPFFIHSRRHQHTKHHPEWNEAGSAALYLCLDFDK